MPGLIPLMLRPASTGDRPWVTHQAGHLPSPATGSISVASPQKASHTLQPASSSHLGLPRAKADWTKVISEAKKEYVSKRYRACEARCAAILANVDDLSAVEPAFLICLHFYAAVSLEMCTRPLPLASPYRVDLIRRAHTHYQQAATLVSKAEKLAAPRTMSGCSVSSACSSRHSPSSSISSQTWTVDSALSSPTTSVCSFEDLTSKPTFSPQAPKQRVKKVSFSLPRPEDISHPTEPFIRPDSPTLGYSDERPRNEIPVKTLLDSSKPSTLIEVELPLKPEPDEPADDVAFLLECSLHRYNEHLGALRRQLARHVAHLDQALAASTALPSSSDQATGTPTPWSERTRALDKQARIERLRRVGWRRERFDPRRYQELCDAVMADLE